MPIIKANQSLPEGSVVITIYGEPGVSKTTLGNTAKKVLNLDFDKGSARAHLRKDTLVVNTWKDVSDEQSAGTFDAYDTLVVDTAKAALDDFLMTFVVERDPKLRSNKLGMYGAIGDEFKLFTNYLRNNKKDLIIIAHAKKDEDTKKQVPDITGQSFNLILRVSDQVGYVSMFGNKRQISWNPTDLTVGKNTANLPTAVLPEKNSEELKTYMAEIIQKVKDAKVAMSEAQIEELIISEKFKKEIIACQDADDLNLVLTAVREQKKHLKDPLLLKIKEQKEKLNLTWDAEKQVFGNPPKEDVKTETAADKKGGKKKENAVVHEQEALQF